MIPILTTKNLILSQPTKNDLSSIIDFESRNLNHLEKWEPKSTPEEVKNKLESWIKECEEGKSARFLIRPLNDPSKIIDFCNFTQIIYGAFAACYLGYKISIPKMNLKY